MLLGDFIKELKHNSLRIALYNCDEIFSNYLFNGTLGELKNNIHYQEEWNKWRIDDSLFYYGKNMNNVFQLMIRRINNGK